MTHQTFDQFLQAFRSDDNCWWLLSSGEMGDFFDAALERIDEAKAENERLRAALAEARAILHALAEAKRLFDIVLTGQDARDYRQTYMAWQSQDAIASDMLCAWHKRDQAGAAAS